MKLKNLIAVLIIVLIGVFLTAAVLAQAQQGDPENPLKFGTIGELINYIADFIIIIALPIATIMVVYAAFLFITAGGGDERVKKAKTIITLAIIGIAILLIAKGAALVIRDVLGANPPPPPQSSASPTPSSTSGVLTITTGESLPNGQSTKDYPQQALQAQGGVPTYAWNVASGSLPPGLNMDSAGTISGQPTTNGNYAFRAKVLDQSHPELSAEKDFKISVNSPPDPSRCVVIDGSGSIGIELVAHNPDSNDQQFGCSVVWDQESFAFGSVKDQWVSFSENLKSVLYKFNPITPAKWTLYRSDAFGASSCSSVSEKVFVVPCGSEFRAFAYRGGHKIHLSLSSPYITLAHELGHSFASLDDEYSETGRSPLLGGAGNCVQNSCPANWPAGTCFDGCNYQEAGNGWYRDAENDLMRDNHIANNPYGPIDRQIIEALISR